ncbi:hypothetical protein ACFYZ2_16635 [Streptomyces sviceus]|uniref:hypothetical protein n=1 Tax=Streptomyces sviceus TaxID=285530 RepID=UPI003696B9CF
MVEVVQQQMALVVGAQGVHGGEHKAEPLAGVGGEGVESAALLPRTMPVAVPPTTCCAADSDT